MSPRKRKKENRGLPPNLYTVNGGTTYRYKRPDTGEWEAFGSNKKLAIDAAKQLNSILMQGTDLVAQVLGKKQSLAAFIETYTDNILPTYDLAEATLENYTISLNSIKNSDIALKPLNEIDLKDITAFLADFSPRSSNQRRERLVDIFKHAIDQGLTKENPAELKLKQIYKKTRKRHTEDGLKKILEYNKTPQWLHNAIDLALITLQRREDLVKIKMPALDAEVIEVIQKKTRKHDTGYLRITIGPELQKVISRCRDNTASPFLLHKENRCTEARRKKYEHWTEISPEQITREFKKVVDASEAYKHLTPAERPTFHELRALGIKRYKDKDIDPQQLAGHASKQMTKNYDADHEDIRWVEVSTD